MSNPFAAKERALKIVTLIALDMNTSKLDQSRNADLP